MTAHFAVHQHLIPGSSALLSSGPLAGATGTVWAAGNEVRVSVHSQLGTAQLAYDGSSVTFYNPKNHAAYRLALPSHKRDTSSSARHAPPSVADIGKLLTDIGKDAMLSGAIPGNVAGRPRLHGRGAVAPRIRPGWLAGTGLGCRTRRAAALRHHPARLDLPRWNWSSPTLPLRQAAAGAAGLTLPAGTHTEALRLPSKQRVRGAVKQVHSVSGAGAVAKAAQFHLIARLRWPAGRAARCGRWATARCRLRQASIRCWLREAGREPRRRLLPVMSPVSVNGAAGHELETTLGSVLQFSKGQVTYTVAGFQTADTILSAAQSLH